MDDLIANTAQVEIWRERLADLGWIMKALKEDIAKRANKEDGCSGAFWEGRFKSVPLLDQQVQTLSEDHPGDAAGLSQDAIGMIDRWCRAMDAQPGEPWRVGELARRCGWSPDYFARLFRQRTGQSPRAYLTRARLHAAKLRLQEDDESIQGIAADLGYADAFHFNKHFKSAYGLAPSRWRHQTRIGSATRT